MTRTSQLKWYVVVEEQWEIVARAKLSTPSHRLVHYWVESSSSTIPGWEARTALVRPSRRFRRRSVSNRLFFRNFVTQFRSRLSGTRHRKAVRHRIRSNRNGRDKNRKDVTRCQVINRTTDEDRSQMLCHFHAE